MELNKVYNEDCLVGMQRIPDKAIDMILCDLPYGTTACKWDVIIPFESLWGNYKRIIKDNGAIVLTASQPFTSALVMSNPKMFKYEWIWEKNVSSNFMQYSFMPAKKHENVLVFAKGKTTYNPIMEDKSLLSLQRMKYKFKDRNVSEHFHIPKDTSVRYDRMFPTSIKKFNRETGRHPTQKPVTLFEYLINTYTNEGETVLDNCMGSGTTAIACINTNRNYVGFEWSPVAPHDKYFNVIQDRIANHKPMPKVILMNGASQQKIQKEQMQTQQKQQSLF